MMNTSAADRRHRLRAVRVTRWDLEPGTGRHVHEYDDVVVPVTDGETDVHTPDGAVTRSRLVTSDLYARAAGAEHEVVNAGDRFLAFVEVELR